MAYSTEVDKSGKINGEKPTSINLIRRIWKTNSIALKCFPTRRGQTCMSGIGIILV